MIVEVGTVFSKIIKCNMDEYSMFREALTFNVPGGFYSKAYRDGVWDAKERLFKGKKFPTGLLYLVLKAVPNTLVKQPRFKNTLVANPYILKNLHMVGKYAYQLKGVQAVLDNRRGILHFATNAGKGACAASFLVTLNKKTLFLVDRKELMEQIYETFTTETDLEIGRFGSGKDNRKFITVGMVQTISRKVKQADVSKWLSELEVVVVDEVQGASAKTFLSILEACTHANYRIGLSGTPLAKSTLDNAKIKSQLGQVIAKISNNDLIKAGVSAKPIVKMIEIEQPEAEELYSLLAAENAMKSSTEKKNMIYPKVYDKGIVENSIRNNIAVKLVKRLLKQKHTILILVKRIKHGEYVKNMLNNNGIKVAFCHGESSDEERETEIQAIRDNKSKVLILSKIGQVGLNIPYLSAGLFLSAGKSKIEVIQSMGRYLRLPEGGAKEILFFDFYDKDNGYLEQHSEIRKGYYEREKFSTEVMEYKGLGQRL